MSKLNGKILIIDDDKDVLYTAKMILKQHFTSIFTMSDPKHLEELIFHESIDVILLDMNFVPGETSGKEGILWLKKIHKIDPDIQVIMNTAYGDIELAVNAMKEGAIDFLVKPWEKEKLISTVRAIFKLGKSKKEINYLRSKQEILAKEIDNQHSTFICSSPLMKEVVNTINKVSCTDANVLVLGENGTGKELIAREIHKKSNRSNEVFINVDLGSISETLFESELFGHCKGAFTDAKDHRIGRFEIASGGTLFLDEIGNLSMPLQAKLLTAIQNKKIIRLGSNKQIPVDIRLICATNKSIYKMVKDNEFRQDLLYRINTVEIKIPLLKEREEDILILIDHFLELFSDKYNKPNLRIAKETYKKLADYNWPGNIRELQHAVERAVIMTETNLLKPDAFLIKSEEIPKNILAGNYKVEEIEKVAIINAIKNNKGNYTKAAEELGLGRSTLYRKIRKYKIE